MEMEMEGEISNFIKVWLTVCASLCYCYGVGRIVSPGCRRLLFVVPVVCLFLYLPLLLTSIHLGGSTSFFVAWLANFKLLLFAFGDGPLSSDPQLSLLRFLAVSCLPIKIQQEPSQKPHHSQNGTHDHPPPRSNTNVRENQNPPPRSNPNGRQNQSPPSKSLLNYAIKGLLVALMVKLYDYGEHIHPKLILFIYSWHVYFLLEIILAVMQFLGRNLLGIELEPQFNDPYFSTSLQDFWGRRWNLMATNILQPTVYKPTVRLASWVIGRKWAPLPAVIGTFLVSALMHELIFYYLGRMRPNWEITWFFVIHGTALTVEILLKKILPAKWRLPPLVSVPLTLAFIFATAIWLFFPQFVRLRMDVRAFEEYATLVTFVKNVASSLVRFFH